MTPTVKSPSVLIAGVGNIFLGDDAFGVEVVRRLAKRRLPDEVRVVDFGIRGVDLAFALLDPYDAVIMVDAIPRGGAPGMLYVLEPKVDPAPGDAMIEMHNLDPVRVLRTAIAMGAPRQRLLVVGCEPVPLDESADLQPGLSVPVQAALEDAVALTTSLALQLLAGGEVSALMPDRTVS